MPYIEQIEARIKKIITRWKNIDQKNMFGGVYKDFIILRLGEEKAHKALSLPHVKPFDITGRPMKGWVMVGQEGFKADKDLADFLNQAKKFFSALPPK